MGGSLGADPDVRLRWARKARVLDSNSEYDPPVQGRAGQSVLAGRKVDIDGQESGVRLPFALLLAALLGGTESVPPGPPFVHFGLRAEVMGSVAVAGLASGMGGAARVSPLLSLGDHVDLQLNLGLAAWASGASMFTVGAGVGVHRSRLHTLLIPGGDLSVGYASLGAVVFSVGTSLLIRGDDRWPVLLGPAVRFEYLGSGVALVSFGLVVAFAPA